MNTTVNHARSDSPVEFFGDPTSKQVRIGAVDVPYEAVVTHCVELVAG